MKQTFDHTRCLLKKYRNKRNNNVMNMNGYPKLFTGTKKTSVNVTSVATTTAIVSDVYRRVKKNRTTKTKEANKASIRSTYKKRLSQRTPGRINTVYNGGY